MATRFVNQRLEGDDFVVRAKKVIIPLLTSEELTLNQLSYQGILKYWILSRTPILLEELWERQLHQHPEIRFSTTNNIWKLLENSMSKY